MPRKCGRCTDAVVLSYSNKVFFDIANPKAIPAVDFGTGIIIKLGTDKFECKIVKINDRNE